MANVCILSSVYSALDNRIFYRQAHTLQAAGYRVTLIAVHPREEVIDGIHILPLPRVPRWQRPWVWRQLYRLARRVDADIYHFHSPELLPLATWLRRQTGAATIYDVHESNVEFIQIKSYIPARLRPIVATVFEPVELWLADRQDGLVFADDQIATHFRGFDGPKTTLFNFPSSDFVYAARRAARASEDAQPMILHVGGHKLGRGTLLMIEAFAHVHKAMPSARLFLVGPFHPSTYEQEIRARVHANGLDHAVVITGRVPFDQVGAYFARASVGWIALQPAAKFLKNIPTKLFEYMAYGIPVVSSDLPPVRQFVYNGQAGFLVPPSNAKAHADAILTILNQPRLANAMGESGRALVQSQYNWQSMETRLLSLYAELLT